MATSNIKLFDENKVNMMPDEAYQLETQRINGVQSGIASSQLQNKTLYQVSLVSYAIAQIMNQNGLDANDSDAVSTFVNNLSSTVLQKVQDIANTAEAQAGVINNKWMSPSLVKAAIDVLAAKSQNILSDETKTMFGLGADAVPDDAFQHLAKNAPKIGDTMTTFRTDLGDNWALCNGDWFDPNGYPELAAITPKFPAMLSATESLSFDNKYIYRNIVSLCEGDGYQVALVAHWNNGNTNQLAYVYSRDWFKTSTAVGINFPNYLSGVVKFVDGYFVIAVVNSSGFLYFSAVSDIENEAFSFSSVSYSANLLWYVFDVWKEDGLYYVACSGNNTTNSNLHSNKFPFLLATTSLTSPTWTTTIVWSNNASMPCSFFRKNGKYIFYGYYSGDAKTYVVYSSSLLSGWTYVAPADSTYTARYQNSLIYCEVNDIWLATCEARDGSNNFVLAFYWTDDITTNSWTYVSGASINTSNGCVPYSVVELPDGSFIGINGKGENLFEYKDIKDPSTWSYAALSNYFDRDKVMDVNESDYMFYSGHGVYPPSLLPFVQGGGRVLYPVASVYASGVNLYGGTSFLSLPIYALPAISTDAIYTYMKVKEDET